MVGRIRDVINIQNFIEFPSEEVENLAKNLIK